MAKKVVVVKPKQKQQRLVAERNVEKLKQKGWKIVGKLNEMTYMEKEI